MSVLGRRVHVVIDRPLGSRHPSHPDIVYPVNYGYVPGVYAGDGEEQDVYVLGPGAPLDTFDGVVIAIARRHDDVEDKWIAAPEGTRFTRAQIERSVHFVEQYFDTQIVTEENPDSRS